MLLRRGLYPRRGNGIRILGEAPDKTELLYCEYGRRHYRLVKDSEGVTVYDFLEECDGSCQSWSRLKTSPSQIRKLVREARVPKGMYAVIQITGTYKVYTPGLIFPNGDGARLIAPGQWRLVGHEGLRAERWVVRNNGGKIEQIQIPTVR